MSLQLQPVQIATDSDDQESRLVFHDGLLVAVLVCLAGQHGPMAGHWFLEAGFGRVSHPGPPTFADLDEAEDWIEDRLKT